MKTIAVSTLVLAAMTSVALAGAPAESRATKGPVPLTAAQMDQVSAGGIVFIPVQGFGGACVFCKGPVGILVDF